MLPAQGRDGITGLVLLAYVITLRLELLAPGADGPSFVWAVPQPEGRLAPRRCARVPGKILSVWLCDLADRQHGPRALAGRGIACCAVDPDRLDGNVSAGTLKRGPDSHMSVTIAAVFAVIPQSHQSSATRLQLCSRPSSRNAPRYYAASACTSISSLTRKGGCVVSPQPVPSHAGQSTCRNSPRLLPPPSRHDQRTRDRRHRTLDSLR